MSVNVDRVYQTVLSIVHKEGGKYLLPNGQSYITPQEFNLLANQAQIEVFESYFSDLAFHLERVSEKSRNDDDYADTIKNLQEKIRAFDTQSPAIVEDPVPLRNIVGTVVNPYQAVNVAGTIYQNIAGDVLNDNVGEVITLAADTDFEDTDNWRVLEDNVADRFRYPSDMYRLGRVLVNKIIVDEVGNKEWSYVCQSPLTAPTRKQPIYIRTNGGVLISPRVLDVEDHVTMIYTRTPATVQWTGSPLNGQFVQRDSTNFELHPSDFPELVVKILSYVGILITKPEVSQFAETQEAALDQEQKI